MRHLRIANPANPRSRDNYAVTFAYDAVNLGAGKNPLNTLDRVVTVTYPDGTFQESDYTLLDAETLVDRGGLSPT
jgi:hypothetical protein